MTHEPSHEDLRDLLGAYALDALDPDERARVDALLLNDAAARAELHELEHAAAWLGRASLRPSSRSWDAIAAGIAADEHAAPPETAPPAVTPESPTRSFHAPRWLVAAAVALLVVAGVAGAVAMLGRSSGTETVAERAQAAIRSEDVRRAQLTATDGAFSAPAVVLPDGTGFVRDGSVPPAAPGRDLQLWSITPDGPVSAGVMAGHGWHEFEVAPGATALAVTVERAGGSAVPTGDPVATGDLTNA